MTFTVLAALFKSNANLNDDFQGIFRPLEVYVLLTPQAVTLVALLYQNFLKVKHLKFQQFILGGISS